MNYDVIIIGAGPGGIFSAYELMKKRRDLKVAVFETGHPGQAPEVSHRRRESEILHPLQELLHHERLRRRGRIFRWQVQHHQRFRRHALRVYRQKGWPLELMEYVDTINLRYGGEGTKLYSTAGTSLKKTCMQHGLHLLDASVRHLGTDINYIVLEQPLRLPEGTGGVHFDTQVTTVTKTGNGYAFTAASGALRAQVRHLRRPQRQQVDGKRLPATWTSPPSPTAWTSACGWSCPPRCSPPDRRAVRKQDRLPHREVSRTRSAPSA